jgi:AcrR family transcriptional regulator
MVEPLSGPTVDGWRLRSERTRQLIVEACLALLRDDPQVPTSTQIAERAGCSVRSIFERFSQTCERWGALWRALNANQRESAELKPRIELTRQLIMKRLELMYRPELSTMDDKARRSTLIALEALTDFESWARMRDLHGLSVEQGCALWIRIIDRILPPTPVR